jgi:tripartite-type tricarboxylate transporter receptor subunit TctC
MTTPALLITRRALGAAVVFTASGLGCLRGANAQPASGADSGFPNRPVRLVVPMSPGTAPDIRARQIAQKLSEQWSQTVFVDNRPGAAGNIAMEFAARAAPDGYTLGMINIQQAINPHLMKVPYDTLKDFVAVSKVSAGPLILLVNAATPASTLAELVRHARAHPGKLNLATAGLGTLGHLGIIVFSKATGTEFVIVPYKGGGAQIYTDLVGNQVQLTWDFASVAMPHLSTGRVKALAVAAQRRLTVLPDVPTFQELGYPDVQLFGWQGIAVPAATPPELVQFLNRAIVKALGLPDVREAITATGAEVGGDTPEQFAAYIRAEHARWGKLIADAGIRLE